MSIRTALWRAFAKPSALAEAQLPSEKLRGDKIVAARKAIEDFRVTTPAGEQLFTDVVKTSYHREYADDPDRCEYFVPVQWLETVPVEKAVQELGMFGNQNTVCKPTTPKWRTTVERLKERFPKFDAR